MMMKYVFMLAVQFLMIGFQFIFGQGENLFDDNLLHEIHFTNMDTSLLDGSKNYQMVSMLIDGIGIDSIGIKEKGNISNNVPNLKVPFKVKTNKYVSGKKYDGIKEFTLHNNYQDPTIMREKITYDICEQLGLFALRTAYAKVFIEGKYWGLYTIVEGKDEMFKQVFDHRDSDAIESLDFGNMCFISNNPDDYNEDIVGLPYYKLENGETSTAFARFAVMIDKANNTHNGQYLDTVPTYLNLIDFFTYQAINVYLMNMDSYIAFRGNQIYMFDTTEQRFEVIPWDFNASLGLWNTNNASPSTYPIVPDIIGSGCIASKMNVVPELKAYYFDTMCKLVNDICEPTKINNVIDGWKNQIQQAVYDDYRKIFTNQDFDETLETGFFQHNAENVPALKTFFAERNSLISQELVDSAYTCNTTSITEQISDQSIRIFPNPTSSTLFFESSRIVNNLIIFNVSGQKILKKNIFQRKGKIKIDHLPAGIYMILINQRGKMGNKKIIVQ